LELLMVINLRTDGFWEDWLKRERGLPATEFQSVSPLKLKTIVHCCPFRPELDLRVSLFPVLLPPFILPQGVQESKAETVELADSGVH